MQRHYERYVKPYIKKGYHCQPINIDYLYTRSAYGKANSEAYRFYYANALKGYRRFENLYSQAQLALIFHRAGNRKEALDLLRRIKQKALESDEMGLYWRDNSSSWFWYQRPIETQALLIHAFAEITPADSAAIGLMQQWLLKQKQTTRWGNSRATAEAIRALLVGAGERQAERNTEYAAQRVDFEEGYMPQKPYLSIGTPSASLTLDGSDITFTKSNGGIAWGAIYYRYTDDIDKIPASDMGVSVRRTYLDAHGTPVAPHALHVGDRIKVRIDIAADRAMDYVEIVDGRPSCVEPLTTRAGWRWSPGLSYYLSVGNTDTRFFVEHLDKGRYTIEYEVYITNSGSMLSGPCTLQCMYAPEFRSVAPARRFVVD